MPRSVFCSHQRNEGVWYKGGEFLFPWGRKYKMAEPKCPECNVQGIENIVSQDSKEKTNNGDMWFNVVYCQDCGYVYGVFAKHVLNHAIGSTSSTPHSSF